MPKKPNTLPEEHWFPSPEEAAAAQRACCGRVCVQCETPAAYAYRKRGVDLAEILNAVIEKELTERERSVIMQYWFEGYSLTEIARRNGYSPASAHRSLNRAMGQIKRYLDYVVQYQCNLENTQTLLPLAVRQSMQILAAKQRQGQTVQKRLRDLRSAQNLPLPAVAKSVCMTQKRLVSLERGEQEPQLRELVQLAEFYGTTTDYLIKGEVYGGGQSV